MFLLRPQRMSILTHLYVFRIWVITTIVVISHGCCWPLHQNHGQVSALRYGPIVPFAKDSFYGFRRPDGTIIIHPRFFYASGHNDGLARVINNEPGGKSHYKWIYIDEYGEQAFAGAYDEASDFSQGRAWVMRTNSVVLIDNKGNIITEGLWSGAKRFSEGLAAVNIGGDWDGLGGKWGYVNLHGECVIPPLFTYAGRFHNGFAIVGVNGEWQGGGGMFLWGAKYGIINAKGVFVVLPKWKSISRDEGMNQFEFAFGNGIGTWCDSRLEEFEHVNAIAADADRERSVRVRESGALIRE